MLSENDVKEELSYAYVHAVTSRAGYSCEVIRKDRDSVDLHICARGRLHQDSILLSPLLAVQLKASVIDPLPDGAFDFRLKLKNYDDLRSRSMVPRILVVLAMPKEPARWLDLSEDALLLRRCAYWCSLLDMRASENDKYHVIQVPRRNVFTTESLRALMVCVSKQEDIVHGA